MNDFSHLTTEASKEEALPEDKAKRLTALAERFIKQEQAVKDAEANLKEVKKKFNKLSQEDIPELMADIGTKEFMLASGQKVKYKDDVSVSIKDYEKLTKFLEGRGDDAIIKVSIEVGKLPQNIIKMILKDLAKKYELNAEAKLFVHPQTMTAYIRELCGIGSDKPADMPLAKIDEEMLTCFTFCKTTIK